MNQLFPEADDASAGAAGRRAENFVAGERTRSHFAELLALPGPFVGAGDFRVANVWWHSAEGVGVEVVDAAGAVVLVWVRAPGAPRSFISSAANALAHHGPLVSVAQRRLLQWVARRLRSVPFELLLDAVRADPAPAPPATTPGPAPPQELPAGMYKPGYEPDSLVSAYGNRDAWYGFFAEEEISSLLGRHFSGGILDVHHTEVECQYSGPGNLPGTLSFYNAPTRPPDLESRGQPDEMLTTDLRDRDVIKGGLSKLDRLLDGVAREGEHPRLVIVRSACVPMVTGDDLEVSVDKFRSRSSVPIVTMGLEDDPFESVLAVIRASASRGEAQPVAKIPNSVNLVGFSGLGRADALLGLLEDLGVTINARILPEVNLDDMRRLSAAEVHVLADSRIDARFLAVLRHDRELKTLRTQAPFGVAGSRAWLRDVLLALGRLDERAIEERWEQAFGSRAAAWEAIRDEARHFRVGFVDAPGRRYLARSQRMTGIPMIGMLAEMGFGIDLLLKGSVDDPGLQDPPLPEGSRIERFDTPEDLAGLLRASDAAAFYSAMTFDQRLTRAGKAQFSISSFEMGLDGALRTARRLLDVCRTPFYRTYGRYLGPILGR